MPQIPAPASLAQTAPPPPAVGLRIRRLRPSDRADVVRIDAVLTGARKPAYWKRVFRDFVDTRDGPGRVGLAVPGPKGLAGYLLGEVRAFEFGSPPCGWIFAVGVDPASAHHGLGSALVAEAAAHFRAAGVSTVRTMARRDDVPLLSFFRSNGFVGGPFVQLELDLGDRQ